MLGEEERTEGRKREGGEKGKERRERGKKKGKEEREERQKEEKRGGREPQSRTVCHSPWEAGRCNLTENSSFL